MYTGTLVQGKSHHISYKNKKRRKVSEDEWVKIADTHDAIIDHDTWETYTGKTEQPYTFKPQFTEPFSAFGKGQVCSLWPPDEKECVL